MSLRGYVMGQGFVGTACNSPKDNAIYKIMAEKKKKRREFWDNYARNHPPMTVIDENFEAPDKAKFDSYTAE